MYAGASETEKGCLRQGDVLDAIPFPLFDGESVVLGKIDHRAGIEIPHPKIVAVPREHRGGQDCITMQVKTRFSPGTVLAHCCELQLRNEKCLLPMISIARVVAVKPSIISDSLKL